MDFLPNSKSNYCKYIVVHAIWRLWTARNMCKINAHSAVMQKIWLQNSSNWLIRQQYYGTRWQKPVLYYLLLLIPQWSQETFGYTFVCNTHSTKKTTAVCVTGGFLLKFLTRTSFPHLIYGQTHKTFSVEPSYQCKAVRYKSTVLPRVRTAYSPFNLFLGDSSTSQILKNMSFMLLFQYKRLRFTSKSYWQNYV
jgi:hypothetical protein